MPIPLDRTVSGVTGRLINRYQAERSRRRMYQTE